MPEESQHTEEGNKGEEGSGSESCRLGDIIEIAAPRNEALHQQLFYISYIDLHKMKLLLVSPHHHTTVNAELVLYFTRDGGGLSLLDESIQHIRVVSRSQEAGFARQHRLLPHTYVDLEFNGDIPMFVTGRITHLDGDQIEITTIPMPLHSDAATPTSAVLYLDFAYQGIPEGLPLRKIRIREGPPKVKSTSEEEAADGNKSHHATPMFLTHTASGASVEWNAEGDMTVLGLDEDVHSTSFHSFLEKQYLEADRWLADSAALPVVDSAAEGPKIARARVATEQPPLLSFVQDLLALNLPFDVCETLRALLDRRPKTTILIPEHWIPVFSSKVDVDDETMASSQKSHELWRVPLGKPGLQLSDGIVDDDAFRADDRRFFSGPTTRFTVCRDDRTRAKAWLIPPLESCSKKKPFFLWKLFAEPLPPILDISAQPQQQQHPEFTLLSLFNTPRITRQTLLGLVRKPRPPPFEAATAKPKKHALVVAAKDDVAIPTTAFATLFSHPLGTSPILLEQFVQGYQKSAGQQRQKPRTASEELVHMIHSDGATYLMQLVHSLVAPHLASTITDSLTEHAQTNWNSLEDLNQISNVKARDCIQRIVAKRYTSLTDVHKDSHHGKDEHAAKKNVVAVVGGLHSKSSTATPEQQQPLFFDPEYDDTPYELLPSLQNDFAETTASQDSLEEFVTHNLMDRHNYPPSLAEDVAATILAKKRRVKEGHYALLDTGRPPHFYYRRTADEKWVLDKTVDDTTFVDTTSLFCSIDKKKNKNNNGEAQFSETPESTQLRLRYLEQRRNIRELQSRITESALQTADALEKLTVRARERLRRRILLDDVFLHRLDEFHAALGRSSSSSSEAPSLDILSPHVDLRNRILGDSDTVRKHRRILDFVNRHCREALDGESPHWWYCSTTVPAYPLIPTLLHDIARHFKDAASYERLCVEDDGEFVDEHTGYAIGNVVCKTAASGTHTPFNVGDDDDDDDDDVSSEPAVIDHELRIILVFIRQQLACGDDYDTATLRIAQELVGEIPTEDRYKQQGTQSPHGRNERDESVLPFAQFKDRECILRVVCAFLFAVQIGLPNNGSTFLQKSNKLPRKLAGFPLVPDENELQGITLLSRLLFKSQKQKQKPWDSLNPWNETTLRQALVTRCRLFFVERPKFARQLDVKRHRRALRALRADNASCFSLWPLSATSMSSTKSVLLEDGFREHLTALLAQGNRKQHAMLSMLKCISWKYSRHDVAAAAATAEINIARTWQTFDAEISQKSHFQQLLLVSKHDDTTPNNAASNLTSLDMPLATGFRDRVAWTALVWYYHLDRPGPIPDDMRALGLVKRKPDNYDPHATLDEKKKMLELDGVKLDAGKFRILMNVVLQKGIVVPTTTHNSSHLRTQRLALRDLLATFVQTGTPLLGTYFCQLLDAHLSAGKHDEISALSLMEDIAIQRLAMWTQFQHWFARDQLRRIHLTLQPGTRRTLVTLIRNMTRVYPYMERNEFPAWMRIEDIRQQRLLDMSTFVELVTPVVLDEALVDAVLAYSFMCILREYMSIEIPTGISAHAAKDWMANRLSAWILR